MKVTALIRLDTLGEHDVIAPGALNDPTGQTITVRAGESALTGKVSACEELTSGHVQVVLELPELTPAMNAAFGELPPSSYYNTGDTGVPPRRRRRGRHSE